MQNRQTHQPEVQAFLQQHLGQPRWSFTLPHGWGNESYFAHDDGRTYFVKLGVQIARYQAMAALGLTPPVLAAGYLSDGTSIIAQPYIVGRSPSRKDYRTHLEQIAAILHTTHHSAEVKRVLPAATSDFYSMAGLEVLTHIQQRWERYRVQVPEAADFVDESLAYLAQQVQSFQGTGLVASHNDICNANWLLTPDGRLYLIDLDSMSLDDPALDIGATLWWYYPPALRQRFLEMAGYANDDAFQFRMHIRMAMHCLHIIIPREQSFDLFDPTAFEESLTDFRAILANEENPQGYED
ncbi:MAG TPA: phosphotransferase [Anaerolineae bacterium]|nr:phosphotransferase [Anaerolineae bacterium]